MAQHSDPAEAGPDPPALKVVELDPDPDEPWRDDVLNRKEIADRLTSIVRGQEAPFIISLDGRWGTGKTFLLKRWAQDLRNQDPKWQAIYYNAWEDDFAGDPLVSVTGQLSEHLKKGALWAKARKLGRLVAPFVQPIVSTASLATTGVPLPNIRRPKQAPPDHLADYLEKRAAKDELKEHLADLAAEVREETNQPLIFIIDELDRCRPTFAIELLERVKHIFDVPNIVFVFGINREELTKSLKSVYGDIEADVYLRRFFDMEFVLPDAPPLLFCRSLVPKYGLDVFFDDLSRQAGKSHSSELSMIVDSVAVILGSLGLALRDMDYCVRLLSLAARGLPESHTLNPPLFALLVALKIENPALYRRFVEGKARGAEIIDHVNARRDRAVDVLAVGLDYGRPETLFWRDAEVFSRIEAAAYAADDPNVVREQLRSLEDGRGLNQPEYLSSDTGKLNSSTEPDRRYLQKLMSLVAEWLGDEERSPERIRRDIGKRIDLYTGFVSR